MDAENKKPEMALTNEFEPIRHWGKTRNLYEQGDVVTQTVKLTEEVGEIAKAVLKNDVKEVIDGIGDAAVVLTNLAKLASIKYGMDISIESCINAAYQEIKDRKGRMVDGTFVKGLEPLDV